MRLIRFITFCLFLLLTPAGGILHAADLVIKGIVTDSNTLEPVGYASVSIPGTDRGALTSDLGEFSFSCTTPFDSIRVSAMGYETLTIKAPALKGKSVANMNLKIKPVGVQLGTVIAKNRREHYSKKNNPAVEFMEKIRANAHLTDPKLTHPSYNYDKYERITLALNDFKLEDVKDKPDRMAFVKDYIDTSVITGKPILNLSVREKKSRMHHRRDPEGEKEYVEGLKSGGVDEFLDRESLRKLYEDVMREVDVYQNDIPLLQQRFVSPLSRIAPDFYKFYLSDTVMLDTTRCVELTFVPRNAASMGFTGRIYVPLGDTTMFIKRIILRVPHDINLNFITNLVITQEFDRATDGTRLKLIDDMVMDAEVIPGAQGVYARRKTLYSAHDFDEVEDATIFDRGLAQIYDPAVYARDEAYWDTVRLGRISHGEKHLDDVMKGLRGMPLYYWGEKALKIVSRGYIPTGKDSKFDFGPLTSTFSTNTVEGFRLRAGGITTANLSKRWFGRGYVAHTFKDHKWKYSAEAEYSFLDKENHSREFPVHSLRLTHLYDMKMLGQSFITNNQDNMFMSWRRAEDVQMLYHRVTKLEYTLEMENNFSLVARLQNERLEPTPWLMFRDGYGHLSSHYTTNSLKVELRYAPGEKFFQFITGRLPINMDCPVYTLSHTWAPRGVAGNRFALSVTETSFNKRFWLSAYGYVDVVLKGGHCWTRSPYPHLLIPNANLSYFIQLESFSMMNPMEFINDSYAQWDLTYWANGALLNNIPLLKKLKLREALLFRGLYGHLSHRNRPWENPGLFEFPTVARTTLMGSTPYMEAGVGLDNILRILRVDYTWRLTYRHNPGACRSGIRFMVRFSF